MFMSAFNVKVRVLYRDWLICEIILAACEYNNNTKGERKRKRKVVIWNSKAKEIFYRRANITVSLKTYSIQYTQLKKINEKNTKNRLKNYSHHKVIGHYTLQKRFVFIQSYIYTWKYEKKQLMIKPLHYMYGQRKWKTEEKKSLPWS